MSADEYYWERNYHALPAERCVDCRDMLRHQVMGTGKPPAVVCLTCEEVSWLTAPCAECNQVVSDWWGKEPQSS